MLHARMLLDLLKAPSLCMVCYGNVSSMRHIYGKSFDNTRRHIFLKTDVRKSRSQWSLNCICTDSVTPRCVHKVSKSAKIRNRYNQVPHLTQDTNGKVTNSQQTPQTRAKRSALSQQVTTKHI